MAKSKFRKRKSFKTKKRDLDASSAITRAGLFLKNQCGINTSKMKYKVVVQEYAKIKGLTIPFNADLKTWIINQFPLRVSSGSKGSIPSQYCEDLRKRATKSEKIFKKMLKDCKIVHVFQKVIPNNHTFYIVDFFIPDKNLCIELDGGYHDDPDQKAKDIARDAYLISKGYYNWRLTNEEAVKLSKEQIIEKINSFPDKKRTIRQVAMEEPVHYEPKTKLNNNLPKKRKCKKSKPIKTEFPELDKIAARKKERENRSKPLS